MTGPKITELETEAADLRSRIESLEERVRIEAVAVEFLRGQYPVRKGDYFLLEEGRPTRLIAISREGKWTYDDGYHVTEPFRIPDPQEYERLYTRGEVAQILSRAFREWSQNKP